MVDQDITWDVDFVDYALAEGMYSPEVSEGCIWEEDTDATAEGGVDMIVFTPQDAALWTAQAAAPVGNAELSGDGTNMDMGDIAWCVLEITVCYGPEIWETGEVPPAEEPPLYKHPIYWDGAGEVPPAEEPPLYKHPI